jgi:hypothetical protein
MKTKKKSRQTVLNDLEACLLQSANVWTEQAQELYEEILTTPHFDPLPLDAVVSMMYRSANPVPHDTVEKIVALGGQDLISKDYQVVASYWKNVVHNAKHDLLFLRSLGFKAYKIPFALEALLSLKTTEADQCVIEELHRLQNAPRHMFNDRTTLISNILSSAMANGRIEVLRAIRKENYAIPDFVRHTLVPALLRGCSPSMLNSFTVPAHAFAVTDFILNSLDDVCRKQALLAIQNDINMLIIPRTSFNQLPYPRREDVKRKITYLEEIEPLWNEKEYQNFKRFFHALALPPLAVFQAERIQKSLNYLDVPNIKRKM